MIVHSPFDCVLGDGSVPALVSGLRAAQRGAQRGGNSLVISRGKENPSAHNVFLEGLHLLGFTG
jgi:hypothetical protein